MESIEKIMESGYLRPESAPLVTPAIAAQLTKDYFCGG